MKFLKITSAALILFIASLIMPSFGQSSSLLWEISGNGIQTPSYLFGTIHMLPKNKYFFTDKMKERFKTCEVLAMEVDMNKLSFQDKVNLAQDMLLPNGKTLKDYLSPVQYRNFNSYLADSLNLKKKKIQKYMRFKPFFSYAMMLSDVYGKVKMYETILNKMAHKQNKKVVGLETIAYQMGLVKDISIEEQIDMFIGEDLDFVKEFNQLVNVYSTHNIEDIYKTMMTEEDFDDFEKSFLIDRNKNWIPKIEQLAKSQPTFIAVGAGHLGGDQGVIELLRKKGYSCKPIQIE